MAGAENLYSAGQHNELKVVRDWRKSKCPEYEARKSACWILHRPSIWCTCVTFWRQVKI